MPIHRQIAERVATVTIDRTHRRDALNPEALTDREDVSLPSPLAQGLEPLAAAPVAKPGLMVDHRTLDRAAGRRAFAERRSPVLEGR